MNRCGDYVAEQFRQFEPDLPKKVKAICIADTSPKRLKVTFTFTKKANSKSNKHAFYSLGGEDAEFTVLKNKPDVDFVAFGGN